MFLQSAIKSYALLLLVATGGMLAGCSSNTNEIVEPFDTMTVINDRCAVGPDGEIYIGVTATEVKVPAYGAVESTIWFPGRGYDTKVESDGSISIKISDEPEGQLVRDCREEAKNIRWTGR